MLTLSGAGQPQNGVGIEERFVISVKTDNAGTSLDNEFTLPWIGTYDVDWGDGNKQTGVTNSQTHTYATSGDYDIKVKAATGRIYFNNSGDKSNVIDIKNWGTCAWTSMENAFKSCKNILTLGLNDVPDLSNVTNVNSMFQNINNQNGFVLDGGLLSQWDVSNINIFRYMFGEFSSFGNSDVINIDITNWNVSNGTDFTGMFFKFRENRSEQSIGNPSGWNTTNATSFNSMFNSANILNTNEWNFSGWNISNVTIMTNFLNRGALSVANYDATLISWAAQTPQNNINVSFGNSQYSYEAAAARQTLISTYGWTITDGGQGVAPEFVIQVKTDNAGVSDDNQFELAVGNGYTTYDYNIETSDGQVLSNNTGNTRITFPSAGTYQLKITGVLPSLYYWGTTDSLKVISIVNWGTNPWLSLNRSFIDFRNCVIDATDLPNLSQCTSLKLAFYNWQSLVNWDVTNLDVSNVTNFEGIFQNCFNLETLEGINNWQIGDLGIDGFKSAFNSCRKLTSTMEDWDVTNIRNVSYMFDNAYLYDNTFGKWNITGDLLVSNRLGGLRVKYLSTPNYDDTLIKWENQLQIAFPNGVGYTNTQNINFGNAQYTMGGAAEAARNTLINTYGWTITDGGGI